MNQIVINFIFYLECSMNTLSEILKKYDSNKKNIKLINSIFQKLTDDILSIVNVKDHEMVFMENKLTSLEKIIKELKLIRYLAQGIVFDDIKIEFTNEQKLIYNKFKFIINSEQKSLDDFFKNDDIQIQLKETKKIFQLLKTSKPDLTINYQLLDFILNSLEYKDSEQQIILNYIQNINKPKMQK